MAVCQHCRARTIHPFSSHTGTFSCTERVLQLQKRKVAVSRLPGRVTITVVVSERCTDHSSRLVLEGKLVHRSTEVASYRASEGAGGSPHLVYRLLFSASQRMVPGPQGFTFTIIYTFTGLGTPITTANVLRMPSILKPCCSATVLAVRQVSATLPCGGGHDRWLQVPQAPTTTEALGTYTCTCSVGHGRLQPKKSVSGK